MVCCSFHWLWLNSEVDLLYTSFQVSSLLDPSTSKMYSMKVLSDYSFVRSTKCSLPNVQQKP